ncbi:FHA domain-containing protein [Atopobiaceae bacterium 24-176]
MNMTVVEGAGAQGAGAQGQGGCHGAGPCGGAGSSLKVCPQCGSVTFGDMDVCYGCLYRFGPAAGQPAGWPWPPSELAVRARSADMPWDFGEPLLGDRPDLGGLDPLSGPAYDFDFDPADADVDEADETGDLSEVARNPRWCLVMEWRGVQAPMAVPADGLTIGRAPDNDVVLRASAVSRHHVSVEPDDGVVLVRDAGALHPATIDGEEVDGCAPWMPGSVLDICGAKFSLKLLDPRK